MSLYNLVAPYEPRGDQPKAIEALVQSVQAGNRFTTLLGATGTGKTFTVAAAIAKLGRPALIISPNKTLAAQFTAEFREFFPENAVEYFVSYFDYFRPEAYLPQSDLYIEKDSSINQEVDNLRHSATQAVLERADTLVIASVSCIYGLGSPEDYKRTLLVFRPGEEVPRDYLLHRLIQMCYTRTNDVLEPGRFRLHGDLLEIQPAGDPVIYRIEFFGEEVEHLAVFEPVTGELLREPQRIVVYPAKHYVTPPEKMQLALDAISAELKERLEVLRSEGKLLEAQRLEMRTNYDLEVMGELGYCNGIENYSRHLTARAAGSAPYTLLDYFPKDFLVFIDESHVAIPQLRAMLSGDRARKRTLVDFGFRLPSAFDNRPLDFEEFLDRVGQVVFISATPGPYELEVSSSVVEQIIRPTGLVDPEVLVRPVTSQIDDLLGEVKKRSEAGERCLVTTLTKKMAEDLSEYLSEMGVRVRYLHSGVDTLERIEILRDLRLGEFDVLVGINLLREGLDLPEVSLVAILDADKEGFLRSRTSLIQTIGRAARNVSGTVILYADEITKSMTQAIEETRRRRNIQLDYNEQHGIVPQTVRKAVNDILDMVGGALGKSRSQSAPKASQSQSSDVVDVAGLRDAIERVEGAMLEAAKAMHFETAAALRDEMYALKKQLSRCLDDLPVAAAIELAESEDLKLPTRRRRSVGPKKLGHISSVRNSR